MKIFYLLLCFCLPLFISAQNIDTISMFKATVQDLRDLPLIPKKEDLVTTASKKAETILSAPASMTIITAQEIEGFGANNLGEILDRVTSMYVLGSYGAPHHSMVAMRGTATQVNNFHVLVLLNGRPLREGFSLGFHQHIYMAYPIQSIEKIEIIRGSGSVLYGSNAYTGVINIITKQNQKKTHIYAHLRNGSLDTWQSNISIAKKIKEFRVQIHTLWNTTEGWQFVSRGESDMGLVNGQETIINPPKSIDMQNKSATFVLEMSYKGLKTQVFGGEHGYQYMNQSPNWGNPIYNYLKMKYYFADISYQKTWAEKWDWQINLNYGNTVRIGYVDSQSNPLISNVSGLTYLGESSLRYKITPQMNILGGFTVLKSVANFIAYNNLSDGKPFNLYGNESNPDPSKPVDNVSENWYTAYFQYDYQPFEFIKIDLGGQFNKTSSPNIDFVPRLNMVLHWKENLFAKLIYGQAFRSPSMLERFNNTKVINSDARPFLVGGGNEVSPEKIGTAEMQIGYKKNDSQFTLTYFNSVQNNLIVRSLPSDSLVIATVGNIGQKLPIPKIINRGKFYAQGLEAEGKFTFFKNFYATVSASWFKVRNDTKEQRSMGMPNFMLKTGLLYEAPKKGLMVGLFNAYFGQGDDIQSRYKEANPPVKPYHNLSLNIHWNMKKFYNGLQTKSEVLLNLYINNLLNVEIYYPEYNRRIINSIEGRAGRAVYASFIYNFNK
jgi:outer membrane receptor for ferrienterochelin and colicins